jgi:TRAP-type C4-dicarboxylate transport system permease small subunit
MLDPAQTTFWIGTLVMFAAGMAMFYATTRVVKRAWNELTAELQIKGAV